jgi:membrane protein DedA with SNARE-associated domain
MDWEAVAAFVLDPGVPPLLIYGLLFFGCMLESFFPPWPSDVIALYAGFLAGRQILEPVTVLTVAILGSQAGVMAAYWITHRWGRAVLEGPLGRYLPVGQLARLEHWFVAYGAPAIAVSRFFPGIRALVTPAAGLARFSAWKVWVYTGASVVVWNLFVVGLGLVAGVHLDWAKDVLVRVNVVTATVAVGGLAGVAGCWLYRRYSSASRKRPDR